jgi:hemerythrin-like domain-containing protein
MTPREPRNPRVVLLQDHHNIDERLNRLIAAVRADDREASQKRWAKVESMLLRHLDVEEMFIFPALAEEHAAEVERLRRDHAAIRRQLGEIGLSLELHTARCEAIESFCTALREHAEREDSLAYLFAERTLPVSVARSIADRVKVAAGSVRRALRGGSAPRVP